MTQKPNSKTMETFTKAAVYKSINQNPLFRFTITIQLTKISLVQLAQWRAPRTQDPNHFWISGVRVVIAHHEKFM
jgi:hypothetical protein